MEQQSNAIDPVKMIEEHAVKCNISPYKLLLKAEVDPSSMSRWRRGTMPNSRTLNRLLSVQPSGKSED